MPVTVHIPLAWRRATGGAGQTFVSAATLTDALDALITQYPALREQVCGNEGKVRSAIAFFINREHVRFRGGLTAPLADGDEIHIIPMISGGSPAICRAAGNVHTTG